MLLYSFTISALDGVGWLTPQPCRSTGNGSGTHCTGSWLELELETIWKDKENLAPPGFELPTLPAPSFSDYGISDANLLKLMRIFMKSLSRRCVV